MIQKVHIVLALLVVGFLLSSIRLMAAPVQDTIDAHTGQNDAATADPLQPKDTMSHLTLPSFAQQSFQSRKEFVRYLLQHNVVFRNVDQPLLQLTQPVNKHIEARENRDRLFLLMLCVFLLLAVIRVGFRKYFVDIFRAFFSPTLSQRQLKDQLYQTPFPAFALNLFFAISAGLYLYFVLLHTGYINVADPLYLLVIFILLIAFIYLVKYVLLRICGWLLGRFELMDNYIFTLFLINKIEGIILLPFILILAFGTDAWSSGALDISIIVIVLLFVYRYVRVLPLVKSQTSFSKFHFFLYLCGFEIAPILIVGKLVLVWVNGV